MDAQEKFKVGTPVWKRSFNFATETGVVCGFEKGNVIVDFGDYKQPFSTNPEAIGWTTEDLLLSERECLVTIIPRMRAAAEECRHSAESWDRMAAETEEALKNWREVTPESPAQEVMAF